MDRQKKKEKKGVVYGVAAQLKIHKIFLRQVLSREILPFYKTFVERSRIKTEVRLDGPSSSAPAGAIWL